MDQIGAAVAANGVRDATGFESSHRRVDSGAGRILDAVIAFLSTAAVLAASPH